MALFKSSIQLGLIIAAQLEKKKALMLSLVDCKLPHQLVVGRPTEHDCPHVLGCKASLHVNQ